MEERKSSVDINRADLTPVVGSEQGGSRRPYLSFQQYRNKQQPHGYNRRL